MAPSPGQGQVSAWVQLVPLLFIFVIFYFLLIRPARKRQKQVQQMLDALKTGDKIVTSGGLLGTVVGVDRNVVQLRVADKVKVDVTRSSIVALQDQGTTPRAEP
ncbi:MAG: preprotein translocase subunit YajC [Acidobacteria bacterium]|nr:preprotein translocase subunit YajC [Acidobacteriota bacterium]